MLPLQSECKNKQFYLNKKINNKKNNEMKRIGSITTLIFDLGGVLVDLDWDRCTQEFRKIGVAEITELLSTTVQTDFILDFESGKISTEEFRDKMRSFSKQEITDKQIDAAWESFLIDVPQEKLDLLLELKKRYRVVMLSNTNPLSFAVCRDKIFKKDGKTINDYFDKLYLSYEMKLCKPGKEIFEQLLKEENIAPNEALFLDDGDPNIETAKLLGIQTRFVKPFSQLKLEDFFE